MKRWEPYLDSVYKHGRQAGVDRRSDLRNAALNAEWAGAKGNYAGVIRQLRFRGAEATIRSMWIYRSLIFVIFLGLAFYLGLPYWERYVDGTRQTLENQQAVHVAEHAKLDQQRLELIEGTKKRQGLLKLLNVAATSVPTGVNENLLKSIVDGQNILLFGDSGAITRSTNGGESFETVLSGVSESLIDSVVDGQNILLFGGDFLSGSGVITRSTNGGGSFEVVPSGVSESLTESVVDGQNILLFGARGAITRSTNGGESFKAVPSGVSENLRRSVVDGQNILLFGSDFLGGSGVITRSTNGGESFKAVPSGVSNGLIGSIVHGQNILLFGDSGAITRSTNGGESFEAVPSGVSESLTESVVDGQNILLFGNSGAITRSTNGGGSFKAVLSGVGENLRKSVVDGQNILLFGDSGAITRSTNGGESFEAVPSGVSESLIDSVVNGQNILLFGASGAITRSTNGGESFKAVPSRTGGSLNKSVVDGQNILLFGGNFLEGGGVITRSTNGGESFEAVPSGVSESLIDSVVDGKKTLLFGHGGATIVIDSRFADTFKKLKISTGSLGDAELGTFLDDELPVHLQSSAPIVDIRRALSIVEARRDVLVALETDMRDKLKILRDAPAQLKREEVRETFVEFLKVCRRGEGSPELTKTCLESWQAQQAAERQNWWQALAVQVPPGVLLLFLLATLGAFYRYSLRMAGFYHSRADALELVQAGLDTDKQKAISALASDLAADKVEFGKANTPGDQAVELAKAIVGR